MRPSDDYLAGRDATLERAVDLIAFRIGQLWVDILSPGAGRNGRAMAARVRIDELKLLSKIMGNSTSAAIRARYGREPET